MTKIKDETKYEYASTLLSQNLSIQRIRQELKEIFGTSISPNTLLEMRQEISRKEKKKERPLPTALRTILGGKSDELKELESFNSLLIKLDAKLESNRLLLQKYKQENQILNQSVENLKKSYISSEYEYKNSIKTLIDLYTTGSVRLLDSLTVEKRFFKDIQQKQADIFKLIQKKEHSRKELQIKSKYSYQAIDFIVKILMGEKKIISYEKDENMIYKINPNEQNTPDENIIQLDKLFGEGISGTQLMFFIDLIGEKVLEILEHSPSEVDKINDALKIPNDFSRLLLYDMFLKEKIEVQNSTEIPRKVQLISQPNIAGNSKEPTLEEVEEEILIFLSQKYGLINEVKKKFFVSPTKIIKALNHIGELWPLNSFKYQNLDLDHYLYQDNPENISKEDSRLRDISGMNPFGS